MARITAIPSAAWQGPVTLTANEIWFVESGMLTVARGAAAPADLMDGITYPVGSIITFDRGEVVRYRSNSSSTVATIIRTESVLRDNSGTREHNVAALVRQAVGAASARVALPALGTSREVYVMASQRCFFRTGDSTVVAASGTSHPLAQDERFYFRVPAGHTHIAFVRDSSDGNITICPVA